MASVLTVAALVRLYDLREYPPGLFPDEAANGEDVLLILSGDTRVFYPRGSGREALFFYVQAAAVWLFGRGVWQLHAASALVGTLTVAALYFATRAWFGRLAGLTAAWLLATSHWHLTLSRTGFRAIMVPLFVALFTALVGYTVRAAKRAEAGRSFSRGRRYLVSSYVLAALAGAALAGGFYTYLAYRVMLGVVVGVAALVLVDDLLVGRRVRSMPHLARYWRHAAVGTAAALLTFAPLGWHFIRFPEDFVGRAGQVSVFNPDLQRAFGGGTLAGTLQYAVRETLMSFFAGGGDPNWRHSVAGYPLLNPVTATLLLLGLAWALRGFATVVRKVSRGVEVHLGMVYVYLLLLLAGMLLPVITTAEGLPHGLRSVGLVVPIFMLAGTAGAVVLRWAARRQPPGWGAVCLGTVVGLLLVSGAFGPLLYFVVARGDPEAHYAYRADLTEVSKFIKSYTLRSVPYSKRELLMQYASDDYRRPYLVLDDFSLQTTHFLLGLEAHEYTKSGEKHPDEELHLYRPVTPESSHEVELWPGETIVFTQSTMVDAERYRQQHPEVELLESRVNRFGQEILRVYSGRGDGAVEGIREAPATHFDLDA